MLHGEENVVCADAGYTGVEKRPEHAGREVIWQIATQRSTYKQLSIRIVLYHPYQMILGYQLLQRRWKQAALLRTFALDVAHKRQCHHRLIEALSSACTQAAVFSHSLKSRILAKTRLKSYSVASKVPGADLFGVSLERNIQCDSASQAGTIALAKGKVVVPGN